MENEMLREKLNILKSEFYKMVYFLIKGKQLKRRFHFDEGLACSCQRIVIKL